MTDYEQGFIEKCAEYGIDPDQLIKEAARTDMLMNALKKIKMMTPKGHKIRAPRSDMNFDLEGLIKKITEAADRDAFGANDLTKALNKTYEPGSYAAEQVVPGLANLARSAKSNLSTAKSLTKGTTKPFTSAVKAKV